MESAVQFNKERQIKNWDAPLTLQTIGATYWNYNRILLNLILEDQTDMKSAK
jgi:hypothetical protein